MPQAYFELNIDGGPDGILNNFFDLCKASPRTFDTRFTGQNGKVVEQAALEVAGCDDPAAAAPRSAAKTDQGPRQARRKIRVTLQVRPCRASGRLTSRGKVQPRKAKGKVLTLGTRSSRSRPSKTRKVKLKLSKKA